MPSYQMLCITTHFKEYQHIRELVRQSAMHVMNAGGAAWGALNAYSYWTMHFDTSPQTLRSLNGIMRRDPRVLRWTVLNLGSKVEDVANASNKNLKGAAGALEIS
ncbi:hypothetical protein EYR36_003832 [Pleurotus pulmonarius]|nr:hypothetical protein EYR36_003832 [Pleurotus pulmonarius]